MPHSNEAIIWVGITLLYGLTVLATYRLLKRLFPRATANRDPETVFATAALAAISLYAVVSSL